MRHTHDTDPSGGGTYSSMSIIERFADNVKKNPDKIAISQDSRHISYFELNKSANRIANNLIDLYSSKLYKSPVAIYGIQSINSISAILGVIKAGGFYLPIDRSTPVARVKEIIESSDAKIIILSEDSLELIKNIGSEITFINVYELTKYCDKEPDVKTYGYTRAYVIYTSGSTGTPKGVLQNHAHVVHNTEIFKESFNITYEDRQSLIYPFNVYGSARDIFNALINGASLHIFIPTISGVLALPQWIISEEITIWCSIVSFFLHIEDVLCEGGGFPTVRILKLGGEVVPKGAVDLFKNYFSDQCFLSCGFASTEIGAATQFLIDKHATLEQGAVLLGSPVQGKEILILDEIGNEVPDGVVGEIVIRSRYISSGYWNMPGLTQASFSQNKADPTLITYKTGDLGLRRDDGAFVHCGRLDDQIKIRGFRVDLKEVEAKIGQCKGVRQVAVVLRDDNIGDTQIVGYVVLNNTTKTSGKILRQEVRTYLPEYMVPAIIVPIEEMPLTPNGKLDRRSLPVPNFLSDAGRLPRTQMENVLCDMFSDILKINYDNIDESFFDCGGHSLLAGRLINAIRVKFNLEVEIAVLFESPTVAQIAGLLEQAYESPEVRPEI